MYTSSYFDRLPPGHARIGISRGTPRGMEHIAKVPALQPGPWFRTVGTEEYRAKYVSILARLDPAEIVGEIDAKAQGKVPVLCCYERFGAGDWCHRAYVSAWLAHSLGLIVPELKDPFGAYGRDHPLLPGEYQRQPVGKSPEVGRLSIPWG